ncbi:ribonuclease H-like protein [Lindgomyces ingoldianus]|uniref:Ribonuclease H-like protein n=1 Tax=Lindgomyces ingoldianus TaxID=673940 RepID=A0ACB6QWR1_9PLEO|nr:ribonuclease H-like protein [Lindgomyces ingoldianus]KAF2471448.1 ribonuclease H-like protein [Lindgomyces ingoldianus]
MADAKSLSTTSSGEKKRKRAAPGYYAVKVGRRPDIYYSWSDTLEQITGFKNAVHRKFNSLSEAEAFMNNDGPAAAKPLQQKFYAVQSGRVPGVYTDWPSAQAQIVGWKGVKHKSFATRAEAEAFVAARKGLTYSDLSATPYSRDDVESEASTPDARKGCKVGDSPSKKQKRNDGSAVAATISGDIELGTGLLPPDAEDGFDRTIIFNPINGDIEYKTEAQLSAQKLQPTGEFSGPIIIYTDGSSLGNGKARAVAGVGVYFGSNDPRNVSEPLPGTRQTNQRAELTAIQRAVDIVPIDREVLIYSDSNYAIKCCTEWFTKWRVNGWKNASGKSVDNRDIIEPIVNRIEERQLAGAQTKFTWLKGHANSPGNAAADALAVNGAREAKQMLATAQ